jgi:hypothetical protein
VGCAHAKAPRPNGSVRLLARAIEVADQQLYPAEARLINAHYAIHETPSSNHVTSTDLGKRRCVFCDSAEPSVEDVWPNWIHRLLKNHWDGKRIDIVRDGVTYPARTPVLRAKCVCKSCNSQWLSDMEKSIGPILTPLLLGKTPALISARNQRTLAAWVMKTTLMIDCTKSVKDRLFAASFYLEFYRHKLPPDSCTIWTACHRSGSIVMGHSSHKIGATIPAQYTPEGIKKLECSSVIGAVFSFVLNSVIFQVALFNDDDGKVADLISPEGCSKIWPPQGSEICWPLDNLAFDTAGFLALANRRVSAFVRNDATV